MSGRARRSGTLTAAATRLSQVIGADDCLLVGGLAVGAHGYPRATDDLDLITRRPLAEAVAKLDRAGIPTRLLRGDPLEGGFSCVKGMIDGLRFDVMPPLVPLDWSRAIDLVLPEGSLKVVDLEGLIRLKLRSEGPQDLMDAAMLVLLHPEMRERARELAVAYRVGDRLDAWLADPRLVRQAREEADLERRRHRSARKKPKARRRPVARPRRA